CAPSCRSLFSLCSSFSRRSSSPAGVVSRPDTRSVRDPIIRIQHDSFPGCNPVENLCIGTVYLPHFHEAQLGAATLFDEHGPPIALSEQRRQRHAQLIGRFPDHDAWLDSITVAEALPELIRARDVDDDVYALLFDPERRHFGEAERLDALDDAFERLLASPGFDDCTLAGTHSHRVLRQQLDFDLEITWIADLDDGRAGGNDSFALLQHPQHRAGCRRAHEHAVALSSATFDLCRIEKTGARLLVLRLTHPERGARFCDHGHRRLGATLGGIELVARDALVRGQRTQPLIFGLGEL